MPTEVLYTAYLQGSLKLSRFGEWWHEGKPFANPRLADLFHRSIVWDDSLKQYFIQIGKQRAAFTCEDCAFFVSTLNDDGAPWLINCLHGVSEPLDPATLSIGGEEQIYCSLQSGHRARFLSAALQVALRHAVDENQLQVGPLLVLLPRLENRTT
jgi:hypothetical protein